MLFNLKYKCSFKNKTKMNIFVLGLFVLIDWCNGQSDLIFPLTSEGIEPIIRGLISVPQGRKYSVNDIFIRFYIGKNKPPTLYHLKDIHSIVNNTLFDIEKPTILYTHGYVELATDATVVVIVEAYLKIGNWNVLVLDWANLGYGDYLTAMKNVPRVAKETGRAVHSLIKAGVTLGSLHLIGFSLGCHVQAGVSRYMASKGMKIHRLTGLDPALPGFYPPYRIIDLHITPNDAEFVDIIHTDTSFYGTPIMSGHADFWPNGGSGKQPGCPPATVFLTDQYLCSHRRSCYYWSEAVSRGGFLARQCADYDSFLRSNCHGEAVAMGPNVDTKIRGNFYLLTAARSPFALEERGIR